MDKAAPDPLQAIRERIDAIDEAMHRLLIERSGVIAELIRDQGDEQARRRLPPRPRGRHDAPPRACATPASCRSPPSSTSGARSSPRFTAMQAPFGVVAGPAADPLAMRDLVRFYFGFSVAGRGLRDATSARSPRWRDRRRQIAVVAAARDGPMVGRRSPAPARRKSSPSFPSSKFPTAPPSFPPM